MRWGTHGQRPHFPSSYQGDYRSVEERIASQTQKIVWDSKSSFCAGPTTENYQHARLAHHAYRQAAGGNTPASFDAPLAQRWPSGRRASTGCNGSTHWSSRAWPLASAATAIRWSTPSSWNTSRRPLSMDHPTPTRFGITTPATFAPRNGWVPPRFITELCPSVGPANGLPSKREMNRELCTHGVVSSLGYARAGWHTAL